MRTRIIGIGILIRPITVRRRLEQLTNPSDPSGQEITAEGLIDHLDLSAIGGDNFEILNLGSRIDHANKPDTMVPARLGQSDSHVARGRLDDNRILIDVATLECLGDH